MWNLGRKCQVLFLTVVQVFFGHVKEGYFLPLIKTSYLLYTVAQDKYRTNGAHLPLDCGGCSSTFGAVVKTECFLLPKFIHGHLSFQSDIGT